MDDTYHNNEGKSKFDWNQIVTKSVETSDGKELGMVDGLEDFDFVVKDGLIDPKYCT
jgi:sporulation protein YlmC with PRC-barrel domain